MTSATITSEQLQILNELLAHEATIFDNRDLEEYYDANDNLHLKIAEFSGNHVLYSYIKELLDRTRIYLILYDPFYRLEYSPTEDHQAIIDAIGQRDAESACAALEKHINGSINGLEVAGTMPEDYLSL